MKSIKILIVLLILLPSILSAQYFEAGIFGGVSNYQGDLAPRFMKASQYAPAFGIFGRYNLCIYIKVFFKARMQMVN